MERAAHILIVDHGSLAFEGAARLLRAEGLAVTRAGGVQEALQIAHDRPLDLILVGDVSLAAGESEGLRREAALAGATLIAHCDESPSWADVTLSARATDRDLLVLVTTLLRLRRADAAAARAQEYERACLDLQHRERAWRETERALRDRTTELRDLNALTMRIGGALSLDEVVRASLDGIAQSLSPDLIVIYARQQDRLVLLGEHSSEDVAWHRTRSVHHVGQCLCGLAAQQGHAVYSRDLASDPRCTLAECREAGLHAFAALPLTAEGEQWGVLGIASVRARDYRPMESFWEAIAGSVALGIRSALLHGQLEERVRELRASEARLSEAQRIARLGHWEYDWQKDELHWSDELYRIWQRDPARFAPTVERFLESIHPDDRA